MKSLLGSRLVLSLCLLLTTIWLCGLPHSTVRAQVPPEAVDTLIVETTRAGLDLGTRTTATVDLQTNVTTTAITGGTRPAGGPNLFHSFDSFSVGTKDIAHFQNDMMLPTANIIARVIGDASGLRQASTIDGILRTNNPLNALDPLNFGAANLFLVNPAGIIFGPNAQLDIKGSFAATTADYLRMTDGALFHTDPVQPSVLSIANVASFGFTNPRPVAISVQGSTLAVPIGQSLSMVGGDFALTSGALQASGGRIQIASVASSGEVTPSQSNQPPSLDVSSFTQLGSVTESGASNLSVSSFTNPTVGAGTILVRADQLTVDGSGINATTGATNGASVGIDLNVTQKILLINSSVQTAASGAGRAGDIRIQTDSLEANNASILGRAISGTGDGGAIDVNARLVNLRNNGGLQTFTLASGRAGNITVRADRLETRDGGRIFSGGLGTGSGGDIDVAVKELYGSAQNLANVPNCAGCFTGIQAQAGFGSRGGSVRVQADSIQLLDGAEILSQLFSIGPGANIDVTAKNILLSGSVTVTGPSGPVTQFAAIGSVLSGSFAGGTGGNVAVNAETIDIANNGRIVSTLLSGAPGNAGNIQVTADTLNIHDRGGVFASSFLGTGNSGDISINADTVTISGLRTSLDPGGVADFTGLSASTATGRGGTIRVTTDGLLVTNKGAIASTTFSSGSAGSINITADDVSVTDAGFIIASTAGSGAGGSIDINANRVAVSGEVQVPGALDAGVAAITAQAKAGSGNAGTIKITADEIDVLNKGIINNDTLSSGQGGTIELNAASVRVANGGEVTAASASTGAAGSIMVNAKDVTVTGVGNSPDPFVTDFTGFSVKTVNGTGGSMSFVGDNVSLSDKGSISSLTTGTGNAGTVDLNTANTLFLSGGGLISATTSGAGAGGTINVIANQASLATGGTITASTSGPGNAGSITLNTNNLSLLSSGQITTSSTSTQANAGKAGSIAIQGVAGAGSAADSLLLSGTNSLVSTTTAGPGQGGNIQIKAGQIQVEQLAKVTAETSGKGQAGNVTMTGDSLTIASGGRIEASTAGEGKGGEIAITTSGDVTVSGVSADGQTRSGIFAKTQTASSGTGGGGGGTAAKPGNAGNITIASKDLLLNSGAQIDSSTTSGGAGGNVAITTAENITIAGSSTRLTSDAPRGDGQGGNITLVAKNITVRDNASVTAATGGRGDAGNVTLTALNQLLLQSAGTVTTSTQGSGKGGTIIIQAGQVLLDGVGTAITADTLRPFADLTITINILHQNDGDLIIQLDSPTGTRVALLSRVGGTGDNFTGTQFNDQATTQITSGSAPFTGTFKPREPLAQLISELVAGNWTLNVRDQATGIDGTLQNWTLQIGSQTFQSTGAPKVIPDNGTLRSTIAVAVPAGTTVPGVGEASGIGGDVTVNAGTVTVQNGATISATTRGSGQGGTVTVNATGPVALAGSGSGLFTDSEASGGSGNINVAASRMTLDNGAKVSAASSGTGDAGNITINAGSEFLSTNSSVTTAAIQASGGNITLLATDMIHLKDSRITASVLGGPQTTGGNILIDPNFIILQNSQIIAQAFQGTGGNINLVFGQAFLADARSQISASSQFGVSGTVNFNSPAQNLSGALVPLEQSFLSGNTLSNQRCAARMAQGQISTFIVTEREGLPQEPGGMLLSSLVETDGTAASETIEPIRVASVSQSSFTPLTPEPVQLSWTDDTCRR